MNILDNISVQRELAINYYKVAVRVFMAQEDGPFTANWELLVHRDAKFVEFTDAIFTALNLVEVNLYLNIHIRGPKFGQQNV
mgnify:CR=1 FL=1